MGVKTIYQTSDGKIWQSKNNAYDHEESLIYVGDLGSRIRNYLYDTYRHNDDIMIRVGTTGYTYIPADEELTDSQVSDNMKVISEILAALVHASRNLAFEVTPEEIFNEGIAKYDDPDNYNYDYSFGDIFGIYTRNQ